MTRYRIDFLGGGYQSVKTVFIYAETSREALDMAEILYEEYGMDFKYNEIEANEE